MSHWWRAYDEAADDPKLQRLRPVLFKAWFNLCCLTSANRGSIPSVDVLVFKLRMSAEKIAKMLAELAEAGLLDKDKTGLRPHNWNGRQFKSDVSTERVQRFRERQRNVAPNGVGNAPETETETETETEQRQIFNSDRESTSLHTAGFEKKPAAGRKANGQAAGARYPAWFEAIWTAYRPIASPNSSKSRALTAAKRLSEKDRESCRAGLAGYVAWLRKERARRSDFPAQHLATFINGRGWEAFSEQNGQAAPAVSDAELQRIFDTINAEREREEQADDLAAH